MQAKNELPNMQGALERTHDNQYHLYNVDGFANHITEGAQVTILLLLKWPMLLHTPSPCRRFWQALPPPATSFRHVLGPGFSMKTAFAL